MDSPEISHFSGNSARKSRLERLDRCNHLFFIKLIIHFIIQLNHRQDYIHFFLIKNRKKTSSINSRISACVQEKECICVVLEKKKNTESKTKEK
jgi:hypothetical protein